MKHLSGFMIFIIVALILFASLSFVETVDAHYNILYIINVTEICVMPMNHPIFGNVNYGCSIRTYTEYILYYSNNDHVWGLDKNNEMIRLHKTGHENHYQFVIWGSETRYVTVSGCSQCPQ